MFTVGIFLDFVWFTTRTEGPHGAYARRARRNRIDLHRGEAERLGRVHMTMCRTAAMAEAGGVAGVCVCAACCGQRRVDGGDLDRVWCAEGQAQQRNVTRSEGIKN